MGGYGLEFRGWGWGGGECLAFEVWGLGLGVQDFGFGCGGFGVCDLRFGVWGLV